MEKTLAPLSSQSKQITRLQQDLEQINKSLFDATAHTAILLTDRSGILFQTNNYFQQLFINEAIDTIDDLPITNTYGSCDDVSWFDFLTQKDERMLPKVEMLVDKKLFYFTIVSTVINNGDYENGSYTKKYIISLTDITNVVELHKNEISISKELAYKQGIFDVTSEYIHNIGNVITGAQHLADRVIKNLEPMQNFFKYFDMTKKQLEDNSLFIQPEKIEEFQHNSKKIEMSLNIIQSSLTDTIKNVLETDMRSLQKGINNIAATIASQQELYKNNKLNMDERVDIGDLIAEIQSVIEPQLLRNQINIKTDIAERIFFSINRIHLYNGLLNLIKNSIHATNFAHDQGMVTSKEITIKAYKKQKEDGFFELDMMLSDQMITSENVIIEVIDNGIGLDKETSEKLFLQGFTTKKDGHGLGLHSFANFLIGNGHSVTFHSEGVGKGARFTTLLMVKE